MTHPVIIKCTECGTTQAAKVEEGTPFAVMVHECEKCNYVIMESEWVEVSMRELLNELNFDLVGVDWYKKYKGAFTLIVSDISSASIMSDDIWIELPQIDEKWLLNFDKINR